MYKRSNSVVNVTLYMDRRIDCETLAASALPLTLHEFPCFRDSVLENPRLSLAAVKSQENTDMMPIIKEELISRIQLKRLTEGKEGFSFDFTKKPQTELTAEENEKEERRRLQNRMAAKRFREKQNTLGTKLQKKTLKFESVNTSLRNQIRELRKEKEILQRQLQGHMPRCHYVTGPYMQLSLPS